MTHVKNVNLGSFLQDYSTVQKDIPFFNDLGVSPSQDTLRDKAVQLASLTTQGLSTSNFWENRNNFNDIVSLDQLKQKIIDELNRIFNVIQQVSHSVYNTLQTSDNQSKSAKELISHVLGGKVEQTSTGEFILKEKKKKQPQ